MMWAMWAAPLEMAADLRTISNASAAILQNPEVIRVSQVRKTPSWPRNWANFSLCSCIATGIHEPTCILWNNLTLFLLQDPLVYQGRRVSKTSSGLQVWQRRLVDGSVAVALYNAGKLDARISLVFQDVGFTSCDRVAVRDLLGRADLGVHVGELGGGGTWAPVPAHGVAMFNLTISW